VNVAIDERVQAIVHARRDQLEEIVRAAVDRELQALVDAELERRANGNGTTGTLIRSTPSRTRICSACGERPAARLRTVCEHCRQKG
jgi:hypothetical protein